MKKKGRQNVLTSDKIINMLKFGALHFDTKVAGLQGAPFKGMSCTSWYPEGKSRRDYTYQKAPTLPVICNAVCSACFLPI